jgi:hypothetical protein
MKIHLMLRIFAKLETRSSSASSRQDRVHTKETLFSTMFDAVLVTTAKKIADVRHSSTARNCAMPQNHAKNFLTI